MRTLPNPFDPNAGLPNYIYVKLAEYLATYIEDGILAPGAMLPGERNLADEHSVSVGTARRATRLLRERGLVVTVPSRGTYVVPPTHRRGRQQLQDPAWGERRHARPDR